MAVCSRAEKPTSATKEPWTSKEQSVQRRLTQKYVSQSALALSLSAAAFSSTISGWKENLKESGPKICFAWQSQSSLQPSSWKSVFLSSSCWVGSCSSMSNEAVLILKIVFEFIFHSSDRWSHWSPDLFMSLSDRTQIIHEDGCYSASKWLSWLVALHTSLIKLQQLATVKYLVDTHRTITFMSLYPKVKLNGGLCQHNTKET